MKKTTERIEQYEVKEHKYFCDYCGELIPYSRYEPIYCCMCERDICDSHVAYQEYEGDTLEKYCPECWELGKEYLAKIEELEEEEERLYDEWHKKCKEKTEESKNV